MGAFVSRRNHGVEELDISTNNAYRYPPKSGCYFGSHFIMGGERFETTQPESYLFGENQDLNFLGNRPVPFPYPAPQAHEPTKTLKSLVNIRKESLKFIKVLDEDVTTTTSPGTPEHKSKDDTEDTHSVTSNHSTTLPPSEPHTTEDQPKYNIEFSFDTDVKCAITIYYFATEEISNKQAIYRPRDPSMNSETFHYKRGANQVFCQSTHIIEPSKNSEEEWQYNPDKEMIPIVIQCVVEEEEYIGHSHMTFAAVEKVDSGYNLKALKQKQMVDGLCYLLQEIYGIENKNIDRPKQDDDLEDTSSECVICLVEMRDTLILPCRHLCLCNCCADNLRYQASNCPICRSPFRALLQIRAMRKKMSQIPLTTNSQTPDTSEDTSPSQEGIPPGYEAISLIEALNGPATPTTTHGTNTQQRTSYPDGENPELDRLLALATGRVAGSQPTSPEESPLVNRRRMRRKASTGSNRSRQSQKAHSAIEEAREVTEELVPGTDQDLSTKCDSELAMTANIPKDSSMPCIRYSGGRSSLNEDPLEDVNTSESHPDEVKVNIDDDIIPVRPVSLLSENCRVDSIEDDGDTGIHTPHTDYECIDQSKRERLSSEGDYEYIDPNKVCHATPDVSEILYQCDLKVQSLTDGDSDLSDSGLSPQMEPVVMATTTNPDGFASSYSSTESTKGLLEHQELHNKDSNKADNELV